jgi:hypothetical protein
MTAPAPRSYTGLAVAIVAAALIVGASIYVAFSGVSTTTVTDTETLPVTTTISTTTVCLCPTAPAPCPCASQEESTTSTYGGGGPTVTTITSTGASIATTTTNASNANHLQLSLGIRSNGGANITISADETNLLSSENNVTAANNFSFNNWSSPAFGPFPCGNSVQTVQGGNFDANVPFPIEIAVLDGNYGADNYTSGLALTTYDTGQVYTCPGIDLYVQYLIFAPVTDNASFYYGSSLVGNYVVSDQLTTSGYWTGDQSTAAFHPFSPGSYTVLAEDEWGDVVLLHFDVVVTTVTETVSSTISSTNSVNSSSSLSSTCTAAAETLTLCHTTSTTYAPPANSSSTADSTSSVTSTTSPCSAPGVTCGSFTIGSPSLGHSPNGTYLSMVITNNSTGNGTITSFVYFIDGDQIGQSQGLPMGDTSTYLVPVPSSVPIVSGQTYSVSVEAFIDNSNLYRMVNVTAS